MQAKRPLALLLGAAGATVSASAGLMYMGDEQTPVAVVPRMDPPTKRKQLPLLAAGNNQAEDDQRQDGAGVKRKQQRALSKKELGLEQSLGREVAHWISSATVYAATQAFYASTGYMFNQSATSDPARSQLQAANTNNLYHGLFGWLQELTPTKNWDPTNVIQSSSFTLLLSLISGADQLKTGGDLEAELYRAVGLLSTNAQCAKAIAEGATRYGKQALLNLAQGHEKDPRVGQALHRLVVHDGPDCRFGPAHLVSLVSLAVADIPDEYVEFGFWALSKAASSQSLTTTHEWRKTLFGDDTVAKTRRTLLSNNKLWSALMSVEDRPEAVQLQAARLLQELCDDKSMTKAVRTNGQALGLVLGWMQSENVPLVCSALDIAAKMARDGSLREEFVASGALEIIRSRILENKDRRLTPALLKAVHCLAQPINGSHFALDDHSLSSMLTDDEDSLHDEGLVHPRDQYVDGWIELFSDFLKSEDADVRDEAIQCMQQIASHGLHSGQGMQEWLIAVLDGVLETVPTDIARASTSVRAAKSRTRPLVGHQTDAASYEASHAKALRALAFVLGSRECQEELVRLGGIPMLKLLLKSNNPQVHRELARALANLFTCDDLHDQLQDFAISDEDLVNKLTDWTQSKDLQLQSLAHRAHSNLRYQRARAKKASFQGVKYLDGVHPLHFTSSSMTNPENSADYDVDVVFLHGLLGCPYETWVCGEEGSDNVWAQEWLLEDLKKEGHNPRVMSIGYDSQLLASESLWRTMNFEGTSEEILKKLTSARVGAGDRPVIFVTHSLGGVLVKQVLLDSTKKPANDALPLVNQVSGVLFYGVPHHGSPVAQTIQTFRPKSLGIDQHPVTEHLHGTPHLKMLNTWCEKTFQELNIPSLSLGESVPCRLPVIGVEALVVPPSSANPGFGEFVNLADSTHIDVCKPKTKNDPRYTLAKEFISKHIPSLSEAFLDDVDVE
ncbi:TPA: hypothetical protein N0F65_012695 [Lagenidium giganteum]|uniref:Protein SERAC1 n=1 Tax=Lagenidium giganteum TaxID=4803 RepID=A0AAV2YA46_9STRA|nr:TPA: hypothetical protein N0F65_012695 [Lagenidium giganteum]